MIKKTKKKMLSIAGVSFGVILAVTGFVTMKTDVSADEADGTKYIATNYGTEWEGYYGANGYVIIGDSQKTYYTDMQKNNDGKTAITDSSWGYTANNFANFDPKEGALVNSLTYGTVVWGTNGNVRNYNLCAPGSSEQLKTRAHQNANQKYFSDVYAGFGLATEDTTYVTVNVSDHAQKVSAQYPITVSVYASNAKAMNAEAYANNPNPDRYRTTDVFYGGTANSALASTTITKQSGNVTFELKGAGEYRIVAWYDNPTAYGEDGNLVTTGTNGPIYPQINGYFFDSEIPQPVTFDTATGGNWEGVYGSKAYAVFVGDGTDTLYRAYTKGIYEGKDGELITYSDDDTNKYKPGKYNPQSNYQFKAIDETGSLLAETGYLTKYYLATYNWRTQTNYLQVPGDSSSFVSLDTGNAKDRLKSSFTFEISEQAFTERSKVYVTVTSYNCRATGTDNTVFNASLYSGYYASCNNNNPNRLIVNSEVVTQDKKGGFYSTFALTSAGAYTIEIAGSNLNSGSIVGVFFDDYKDPEIAEASLTLDGKIGLNFYAKTNNLENAAMRFTYENGKSELVAQPAALTDGLYKFTARIVPKDYAKQVKAELLSGDTVLDTITYSVKDYCDYIIENSSDTNLVALCSSLSKYGKIVADYFSSETVVSEEKTLNASELETYEAKVSGSLPVTVRGIALRLESGTDLRLYVDNASGITATVDGKELAAGRDDNGIYFEIGDIVATELSKTFVVTLSDGTNNGTLSLSAYSYVYVALLQYEQAGQSATSAMKQLALVAESIYSYGNAAATYFN